jgi:glycosyltransferase involved in cell wall biosynthesis
MSTTSSPSRRALLWAGPLPPHQGGSALSGFQLLVGLARTGHRIRSLAPITPETAEAGARFDAEHPPLGVTRFEVPYSETSPHTPAAESYRQAEQRAVETGLSRLIERDRPDVVILGRETFAWQAPTTAERHALPCILRIAGGFLAGVMAGNYHAALVSRWVAQVRKVDLVTAQTESVAADLGTLGLTKIRIIPNGVDLRLFSPAPRPQDLGRELGIAGDRLVVMHVSNLKPLKRALDLVESAARAVREDPRLVYVVVGDGIDRGPMEAACRGHGLVDHFRFVGWVPYPRVASYLHLADVVVMPSESEAQARVYLETQACARVLVASDIAAARHVVDDGETGLLFRKGDVGDLTAKILQAAADPALRARIGASARRAVAAHSLDGVAAAYSAAIEDVLRQRRG